MTDYASIKVGGLQTPLNPSTTNTLLRDADPALFYMLDFFSAMLRTHLGARFAAQAAKAGIPGIHSVLGMSLPLDPAPWLATNQLKFPLLAIYRTQDTDDERTRIWTRAHCDVTVNYVLPPLTAGQAEILAPILNAVSKVISQRIEQGMDPTYTPPGGIQGDSAWQLSGLDRIWLKSSKWGGYDDGEKLFFPAWTGIVQLEERSDFVPEDYEDFSGAIVNIDLKDHVTDTVLPDVVVIDTSVG